MSSPSPSVSFSRMAFRRLLKNKSAVTGIFIIVLALFTGIFAYYLAPDPTPNANTMMLEVSGQRPGFHVLMLAIKKYPRVREVPFWERLWSGQPAMETYLPITSYQFQGDSLLIERFVDEETTEPQKLDLLHILYALPEELPVQYSHDTLRYKTPDEVWKTAAIPRLREEVQNRISQKCFWLGSDKYGRDILSRIIVGVRVSLSVGLIAVCVSLSIGILLGAMAGYFRGWVDECVMWLINVIWSIPTLLLVFALTIALGKGFWQIFLAVGLTMWVSVARIIRGQVLGLREATFIEATHALGYGHSRIIIRHILPNILGPVLVVAANNFATAIVVEAGLSFLGIGIQPPTPSWGLMLQENYGFIITHNPFLAIAPGLAIMMMVLAFNLLGNGLHDAMDVKV